MFKSVTEFANYFCTHAKVGDWKLRGESIRNVNGMCVICWVGHVAGHNPEGKLHDAPTVGGRMGLDDRQIYSIMVANGFADAEGDLRTRILTACGLTKEGE